MSPLMKKAMERRPGEGWRAGHMTNASVFSRSFFLTPEADMVGRPQCTNVTQCMQFRRMSHPAAGQGSVTGQGSKQPLAHATLVPLSVQPLWYLMCTADKQARDMSRLQLQQSFLRARPQQPSLLTQQVLHACTPPSPANNFNTILYKTAPHLRGHSAACG